MDYTRGSRINAIRALARPGRTPRPKPRLTLPLIPIHILPRPRRQLSNGNPIMAARPSNPLSSPDTL